MAVTFLDNTDKQELERKIDEAKQMGAVTSVNGKTGAVALGAEDVGADSTGTANSVVSQHNTSDASHNDIRLLIQGLTTRLNALADSDDTTLDQMSEIVAYIKENKDLIDSITTSKVNVADIIDNLTTNVANKPLSAKQGVALKALIDALSTNKLDASALTSAIETALAQAKASGEFDGVSIVGCKVTPSDEDGGENVVTLITSEPNVQYRFVVKNGSTGSKGNDGKTPVKGTDYFTPAEQEEMVAKVTASLNAPDYVVTEAESVIDRVLAAQGNRTFTFAAITDLHFGNDSYTDGIKHACQAMKYIDSRIKLDAVAVLGDYTDSYPARELDNALGDFKAINSVLDDLRFAVNLRQQGNHDYYADNAPITNRFIQSYSDDVVWGNKIGGYYLKDFEDVKLRVISVNTAENSEMAISNAQYQWLADSLDLSHKEDATEWHILILSHHPLDWWSSTYVFTYILNAYQKGNSWSGEGISVNFAGKNQATLIGNIHGHIHNLKTDYLHFGNVNSGNRSSVLRMATPNACYGRDNQYDEASVGVTTWVEDTTYAKTKNSAKDTAFCIYCVDLDTTTVTAICYGAGYDRTVDYINGTVEVIHSVTNNLTNMATSNSVTSITNGDSYTATLTTTNGEAIESVVVTMNGTDITASVYSNGVITIPVVTGSIVITAQAKEVEVIVNLIDTVGVTADKRLSTTSGTVKDNTGTFVTGFIPISTGDVIRTSGANFDTDKNGNLCMVVYNNDQSYLNYNYTKSSESPISKNWADTVVDENGNLTITSKSTDRFIRLSGIGTGEGLIVTKNQIIE